MRLDGGHVNLVHPDAPMGPYGDLRYKLQRLVAAAHAGGPGGGARRLDAALMSFGMRRALTVADARAALARSGIHSMRALDAAIEAAERRVGKDNAQMEMELLARSFERWDEYYWERLGDEDGGDGGSSDDGSGYESDDYGMGDYLMGYG